MQIDIVFLDIDGVLNPDKDNHPHVFAPDCVAQLQRILDDQPQVYIVFSSSWRNDFSLFALGWHWRTHNLPLQRVIGRTPDIHLEQRGEEILKWLDDAPRLAANQKIRRFAVLDDEPERILKAIPSKHVFACNPFHGLTEEVADRVISHFKSKNAP